MTYHETHAQTIENARNVRVPYEFKVDGDINLEDLPGVVITPGNDNALVYYGAFECTYWVPYEDLRAVPECEVAHIAEQIHILQENIQRGVAWLDIEFPGWARRIDLDALHVDDAVTCVLAQVTGKNYLTAIQACFPGLSLFDEIATSTDYGFNALTLFIPHNVWVIYAHKAWTEAIIARR